MNPKIHTFQLLPSTNKKAFELAQSGASHGEVVRAFNQSEGRGRLGKAWVSPVGKGLYFSIIVRPNLSPEEYPKLTLTAGVAIAAVMEKIGLKKISLKWPNDVYLSGKKCCGILSEASISSSSSSDPFAVIGLGLNVLTELIDFPMEIRSSATSLLMETGIRFDLDTLLNQLHQEVLKYLSKHEQEGFIEILKEWKIRDYLYGKWLKWVTNSGGVVEGVSMGPDDDGQLLVRDSKGVVHQVLSGDISLAGKKNLELS